MAKRRKAVTEGVAIRPKVKAWKVLQPFFPQLGKKKTQRLLKLVRLWDMGDKLSLKKKENLVTLWNEGSGSNQSLDYSISKPGPNKLVERVVICQGSKEIASGTSVDNILGALKVNGSLGVGARK